MGKQNQTGPLVPYQPKAPSRFRWDIVLAIGVCVIAIFGARLL